MIKYLKNTSGGVLRLPALHKKFPVDYVWQIPCRDIDVVMTSLDTLTAIRSGDLQVGWSDIDFYSDPVEGEAFLKDTFTGVNTIVEDDGTTITELIPDIVTDIETGKKTTSVYFQILQILRELYNDASNPLYKSGFECILDKLTNMIADVAQNTLDITTNSGNISTLQSDVANNASDITSLQSDVTDNTTGVATNSGNISTLQSDVANNASDIGTLQTGVANNTSSISTNSDDITTLQSDVTTNTGEISALQSEIDTNSADISSNSGNITTLQTDVLTNTTNIADNSADISSLQNDIILINDPKERLLRPHDILFYYGYLNSYNSNVHAWNNEKVAQDMARYNILVFGDGVQDPGHGDYANSQAIILRVKELNPNALVFGYVTIFQDLATFQTKADQWDTLEIDGIFLDEAGYDYGTVPTNGRDAFNTKVDYVHGLNYATRCFANSWNMDHVIGTVDDGSYPNATYNVSTVESNLNENDWYLLESFAVNSDAYASNYEAHTDWFIRGNKAVAHRDFYDINIASVSIIENTEPDAIDLFNFVFTSGMMFSLDAVGSSDISYGASSSIVVMWERPDVSNIGRVWMKKPNVLEDLTDADAYIRFTDFGKLSVDFTSGAEESEIIKN